VQIPWYIGLPLTAAFAFGFLYWAANRAPYYPLKYPKGLWELQSQLGAEDVWLETRDGVRLHAWWVSAPQSTLATLYLHGNAGNVTYRFPQMRDIPAAGSSVLMLDYRGYGKSQGSPSESGLYADADAAYQYLLSRGYRAAQIILQGESLGTAVAVDLASRQPCGGLVLESAFASGREVAGTALPILGPLLFHGFDTKSKIGKIHAPILFFHGQQDDIIPLRMGRALFDAAPQPKMFYEIPRAGHNDLIEAAGPAYVQQLHDFYARLSHAER
jgi:fermentation-respiration switch protein FrsA (DUF1100 family)